MSNLTEGAVYTRGISKMIWGNKLQEAAGELDAVVAYAIEDFLHQNLITFTNVFLNAERGLSKILRVHAKSYGQTLFNPDMRLALFNKNECDISPVKNNAFNWGTLCKGEHVLAYIDILGAAFKTQVHNAGGGPLSYYADYVSDPLNLLIENENLDAAIARSNDLVGLLICKATGQFAGSATLKIGLEVDQL